MNVPPIEIRMGELRDAQEAFRRWTESGPHGKSVMFLTPKGVQSIFSEQRLRLIRAIREHPDFGVVRLAQQLERKQEAISRDVSFLKGIGVIKESKQVIAVRVRRPAAINAKVPKGAPFFLNILL